MSNPQNTSKHLHNNKEASPKQQKLINQLFFENPVFPKTLSISKPDTNHMINKAGYIYMVENSHKMI